ncbi:MAG: FAD binding domain-containing protein [Proteobacteria bacterium]|nr:FAD binding domain-containing protein [Pseudomonadota bacterium]
MLRLPRFGVVTPQTVEDVVAAINQPGARIIAGGTDLLPNLKHRLEQPALLVSLSQVEALRQVGRDDRAGVVRIGAGVTLTEISENHLVRQLYPSLARAAGIVASPSIRNMATIGGNINLDTRCRYVNQSEFWRSAIGGCLKSEGTLCHVVKGGRNCVAAMSSDCVPVLTTLDATVVLVGPAGERRVAIAEYYNTDGVRHINKEPGEFMTEVQIPVPKGPRRSAYAKWTVRKNIDFPLVSVAMRFDLDADSPDARMTDVRVCVGVLNAKPRLIRRTESLAGKRLSDRATVEALCQLVYKQSKPLENVPYEAPYRRKMIPVYTRRAIEKMLAS